MPDISLDPETHLEHRGRTLAIIAMNIIILTIVAYAIRNVGEMIPFPLDGFHGYNHHLLKEQTSTVISGFLLMYYQTKLRKRFDTVCTGILSQCNGTDVTWNLRPPRGGLIIQC